jgi:hypothetical protein
MNSQLNMKFAHVEVQLRNDRLTLSVANTPNSMLEQLIPSKFFFHVGNKP